MEPIKVNGWKAELDPEKDNSCVVSFRIDNVKGAKFFVPAFNAAASSFLMRSGFDRSGLIMDMLPVASHLYTALKESRDK
jgi:hypothetical protein